MTRDEAKRHLLRYRVEGIDANDPEITAALELARRDSTLDEWLTTHRLFQKSAREELRRIPIPPDLKSRIIANRPVRPSFWRRREFLALAASIAILVAGTGYWLSRPVEDRTFANFQTRMMNFALRTYEMDILTTDPNKVRGYLSDHGAPANYSLTPALAKMPVKGGGRLSWQNHPVGMICFPLPQNETLYLFVVDQATVPDNKVPDARSLIIPGKHLSTATWKDGQRIYMLAAHIDTETLAKLADQHG